MATAAAVTCCKGHTKWRICGQANTAPESDWETLQDWTDLYPNDFLSGFWFYYPHELLPSFTDEVLEQLGYPYWILGAAKYYRTTPWNAWVEGDGADHRFSVIFVRAPDTPFAETRSLRELCDSADGFMKLQAQGLAPLCLSLSRIRQIHLHLQ